MENMRNNELAPIVFWAWNTKLEKSELEKQLSDFASKGIGGVFVHARTGLNIPYMGEEWMDAFAFTLETSEKLGLDVWIYDEYGWPSGFGGGKVCEANEEYQQRYLLSEYTTAQALADKNIFAAYDIVDGAFFRNEAYMQGKHYFLYEIVNPHYIDITNKDAVDCFIQVTHEAYKKRFQKYFGNVIKGIFTDEPHVAPQGIPVGKYLVSEFEKNNGYSFYEAAPYLFYNEGTYKKHRYNYWKNVSALIKSAYADKYSAWCKENGLVMTGHFACEEGLVDQIPVSGGVMPLYENMQQIGVDALGNRLVPPAVFKQAESVAHQIGNGKILCESFAGSGYDASFADMLWIWSYQASLGVNVPCLSISMYSLTGNKKRDYPQFFSYQMPWWEQSESFFTTMTAINRRLSAGARKVDILVVHPKTSIWCERGFSDIESSMRISAEFRNLTESLIELQQEFDYGDEQLMERYATVSGNTLSVGKQTYGTVILPEMTNISATTLSLLRTFVKGGGKVVITNACPTRVDGEPMENVIDFAYTFMVNRKDFWRKYFRIHGVRHTEFLQYRTRDTVYGLSVARRYYTDGEEIFAVNKSRNEKLQTRLKTAGRKSVVKETFGGVQTALHCEYNEAEDCTYAEVTFDPQEFAFFRFEQPTKTPLEIVSECIYLNDFTVEPFENTYTLDKISYSVDDGEYSEEDFAIKQNDRLYRQINGIGKKIKLKIKYTFTIKEKCDIIYLGSETLGGTVFVNGVEIQSCGVFYDKDITKYDIANAIRIGQNEAIVEREIPPFFSPFIGCDVFQSITNVLSYPYYMENAYLIGSFDVVSQTRYSGDNCECSTGDFVLQKQTAKHTIGDFTKQNAYFFSGAIYAQTTFFINEKRGGKYYLSYGKSDVTCFVAAVNGHKILLGVPPYKTDITEYLRNGENVLRLTLYSGFRNLLGPHHHKYGKHYYTGPSVFEGRKEWQDEVIYPELKGDTWTENYSFVRFGLREIKVERNERNGND